MRPVISHAGSGNPGIATTLPGVVYAGEMKDDEEHIWCVYIISSHLTAIFFKQSLGRLSALCRYKLAATGSICGITYLMGSKCRPFPCREEYDRQTDGYDVRRFKANCALRV
ncbi:MAG: L-serine ammonia-lyase, iron-sulfur-dependent, subunit alpha [Alistipes putredinis]